MFAPMSELPILKQASNALKPHEPDLLKRFAKVFRRKKPPQTMRSLAPLAMVFLLEAFGLVFLLDRATVRLALAACRGPGKDSEEEEDDLLDNSDDMVTIRWAAERHRQIDIAYRAMARDLYNLTPTAHSFSGWLKMGYGPDRTAFEKQWGERNPIDPSNAPKCFDPSAQLSILDAVGDGDGYLGTFVSNLFLLSSASKQIECMGQTLDLGACETLDAAAWCAVSKGWIAYLDHRGVVVGLRLIPRTDGIQTRLRAPLANIVAMYADDPRDEQIKQLEADKDNLSESNRAYCENNLRLSNKVVQLETNIKWHEDAHKERDQQWQDATGASDPEYVGQIETKTRAAAFADGDGGDPWIDATGCATPDAARDLLRTTQSQILELSAQIDEWHLATNADSPEAFVGAIAKHCTKIEYTEDTQMAVMTRLENETSTSAVEVVGVESPGIWRMVWPDDSASPSPIACANTIVAHRRGEFAELEFPTTPKIFEQVRAWLMFNRFGICTPSFDSSKYGHCAIGANGEIPPSWGTMKESKRNAYPGFVLFAPDNSARVVFRAKGPPIGKPTKARKVKA